MKTTLILCGFNRGRLLPILLLGLLVPQVLHGAAGFNVTPSTVSNSYRGVITLQVTGLTPGATVVVQKFLDANTNNVIDGDDLLWQYFELTDGQASVIGDVTNINVPGDLDPAPGQITARLIFRNTDEVLNLVGKYLFKLSSPTSLFTPITNSFAITDTNFGQSLTGNVVNDGTNVPNAIVLVFTRDPGDGGPGSTVGGTVANNAGGYAIKLPVGKYGAVALKSNYLSYLLPPLVTLGSGQTIVTDLVLGNTTRTLSGRIVDAANPSVGLPGLFAHADNGDSAAACTSDANGNVLFRVGDGKWQVGASGMETLGYLNVDADELPMQQTFNTITGDVSGVSIPFPKADALFHGSVTNEQGQPLAGIRIESESNEYLYYHHSFTDDNGQYVAGALGGGVWELDAENEDTTVPNYLFPQNFTTNINVGQAVRYDFAGLPATNRITGQLQDHVNNPIPDVEVFAYAGIAGDFFYVETFTDDNGEYSMNVVNGTWYVGVNFDCDTGNASYCPPNGRMINVSNADAIVNFSSPGRVDITTSSLLPEGQAGEEYLFQFTADTCGGGVNWSATNPPPGLELSSSGQLSGYPAGCGSNYFFVHVEDNYGSCTTEGFSLVIQPPTNGVVFGYYVNKLRSYRQTNATSVVLDGSQGPHNAYLGIIEDPPCSVTYAACTTPSNTVKLFPPGSGAAELQIHETFANEAALDGGYPSGDYLFEIQTAGDGYHFPVLNLPPANYPNAPRISNYTSAQAINPVEEFDVYWDAFSDGTSEDFIRLFILDTNEVPAFTLWWYPQSVFDVWDDGTATTANIPSHTLEADRTYLCVLEFIRVVDFDQDSYTNTLGLALLTSQTVFSLATTPAIAVLEQPAKTSPTEFRFQLNGIAGQDYAILKSTNLNSTNWSVLLITNAPTPSILIIDPWATNDSSYYRALSGLLEQIENH